MSPTILPRAMHPLVVLLAGFLPFGCALSLQPAISEPDATFDARLLGVWADDSSNAHATIARGHGNAYAIDFTDDDGSTGQFEGRVGTLAGRTYLEVWPAPPAAERHPLHFDLMVPAHLLFVIEIDSTRVRLARLNPDSLAGALRSGELVLAHVIAEGDSPVLVGSTAQLRAALPAHVAKSGVLGEWWIWSRAMSTAPDGARMTSAF